MLRAASLALLALLTSCERLLPFPPVASSTDSPRPVEQRLTDLAPPNEGARADLARGLDGPRPDGVRKDGVRKEGGAKDTESPKDVPGPPKDVSKSDLPVATSDSSSCPPPCTCPPKTKTCLLPAGSCTSGCVCPSGWSCIATDPSAIDCSAGVGCTVVCQSGACLVNCGTAGCPGLVHCSGLGVCNIMCMGANACAGGVTCSGPGKCNVTCTATACAAAIDCQNACACDATCYSCASVFPAGNVKCKGSCTLAPWGCSSGAAINCNSC